MRKYLIDTDVLIGFYESIPMEIYETQWELIKSYISEEKIILCEAVVGEVKKADELKQWLSQFSKNIVPCYTREVIVEAKTIINDFPKLIDVVNPSDQADPYVIAVAKLNNYTVLSNEILSEGGKKMKIPYVCKQLSIDCMNTKQFYQEEKWKF